MLARSRIQESLDEVKAEVARLAQLLKDSENQIADRRQRIATLSTQLDDATKRRDATGQALISAFRQAESTLRRC